MPCPGPVDVPLKALRHSSSGSGVEPRANSENVRPIRDTTSEESDIDVHGTGRRRASSRFVRYHHQLRTRSCPVVARRYTVMNGTRWGFALIMGHALLLGCSADYPANAPEESDVGEARDFAIAEQAIGSTLLRSPSLNISAV